MKKLLLFCALTTLIVSCSSNHGVEIFPDVEYVPINIPFDGDCTYLSLKDGDIAKNASYYNDADYFYDGIAIVVDEDDNRIFIDNKFRPINDKKYCDVTTFNDGLALAVEPFGHITALDTKGKTKFVLDFASVATFFKDGISVFETRDGKYGAVDVNGKIVIEPKYDDINIPQDGLCLAEIDEKYGIIDTRGKEVVPCKYDRVQLEEKTNSFGYVVVKKDDQWGVVDFNDKIVLPFNDRYENLSAESGGLFAYSDNYYGWVNKKGKNVIPEKYYSIHGYKPRFNNYDVAIVRAKDSNLLIDRKGRKVADLPSMDGVLGFDENGLCIFESNTAGAFNSKGEIVIQENYDWADGLIYVGHKTYMGKRNGYIDVIDASGKVIKEISSNEQICKPRIRENVKSHFVDIDKILSDISEIIKQNQVPYWSNSDYVVEKYDVDPTFNYWNTVVENENEWFKYSVRIGASKQDFDDDGYSFRVIDRIRLKIDLKNVEYKDKERVYSKISEYFGGQEESDEIVVPEFSNYHTTFSNGTFDFTINE